MWFYCKECDQIKNENEVMEVCYKDLCKDCGSIVTVASKRDVIKYFCRKRFGKDEE